jgi:hypothetical protein
MFFFSLVESAPIPLFSTALLFSTTSTTSESASVLFVKVDRRGQVVRCIVFLIDLYYILRFDLNFPAKVLVQ